MSDVRQPLNPATPAAAPTSTTTSKDGAADVYRRAVEAKPTGFAENPIGAMASAVDRFGHAAGRILQGKATASMEGQDGLAASENRLKAASEAVRANPGSLQAKQEQLKAAAALLRDMKGLAPNDPRRVKVSEFIVKLANQLGPDGIPMKVPGLDMRGLLRHAAQIAGRYGGAESMQSAFGLEGILKGTMPQSAAEALATRDAMMKQLNLSKSAQALIAAGWGVRLAGAGEMPGLDAQGRMMVLDAAKQNASLSVLARAYWHDTALSNPADHDGFIAAFVKLANQGTLAVLNRKYKELRRMAKHELQHSRELQVLSHTGGPVMAATSRRSDDDSGDMFAALAVFSREDGHEVPESLAPPLKRFFA